MERNVLDLDLWHNFVVGEVGLQVAIFTVLHGNVKPLLDLEPAIEFDKVFAVLPTELAWSISQSI